MILPLRCLNQHWTHLLEFDKIDVDGTGEISLDCLKQALLSRKDNNLDSSAMQAGRYCPIIIYLLQCGLY